MTSLNPRELQKRQRKQMKQALRQRRGNRILTTIKPVDEMLWDHRFSEGTAQFLAVYSASASGEAERQDCFVCLEAASPERDICSVGVAEFVEQPDTEPVHSLMFGICCSCCWDKPAVIAALRRDFGDINLYSAQPGTA
jgi:hypothetical protein